MLKPKKLLNNFNSFIYIFVIFLIVNPSLINNSYFIFVATLILLPFNMIKLLIVERSIYIEKIIIIVPITGFFVYIISLLNDFSPDQLFRLSFIISPMLIAPLLYWAQGSDKENRLFNRSMSFAIFVLAMSQVVQFFLFPDLFGFIQHPIYNGDLIGTSSFRAIGFGGSPQNCAFFLSIGLFLSTSINNLFFRFVYLVIITSAGLMTLSTFFGVILAVFIFTRYRWLIIFLPITMISIATISVENTIFESFNYIEILHFMDRIIIPESRNVLIQNPILTLFFGVDIGIATSGIIDLGYFRSGNYNHESWIIGRIIETGLVGLFFYFFVYKIFLMFLIKDFLAKLFANRLLWGISLVVILASFVTPNFDSPRISVIFWLIFFMVYKFEINKKKEKSIF